MIFLIALIFVLMALTAFLEAYDPSRVEIDRLADESRQRARKPPLKRNVKYSKYWNV